MGLIVLLVIPFFAQLVPLEPSYLSMVNVHPPNCYQIVLYSSAVASVANVSQPTPSHSLQSAKRITMDVKTKILSQDNAVTVFSVNTLITDYVKEC